MNNQSAIPACEGVTVHLPMTFVRRGGRKLIIAPDGDSPPPQKPVQINSVLVKALARAFRWRKLLESGHYSSLEELAKAEKINPSFVSRILRLTLLAPRVVEAILDGRQPGAVTLRVLTRPFPLEWQAQKTLSPPEASGTSQG